MNQVPLFKNIEPFSELVEENDFFKQYTNESLSNSYEVNYLVLKFSPTLEEFKIIEKLHREYQCAIDQSFLNLYWPQDKGITLETLNYLDQQNYKIGMQNLYWLNVNFFHENSLNHSSIIKEVNDDSLSKFLSINYTEDVKYGDKLAKEKRQLYSYQFQYPNVKFILAYLDHQPVGSMTLIFSKHFLEIDNLLTTELYRNKGVATNLINYAKKIAHKNNQSLILIADAEDTPKEMYENMEFKFVSYQINARKVLES